MDKRFGLLFKEVFCLFAPILQDGQKLLKLSTAGLTPLPIYAYVKSNLQQENPLESVDFTAIALQLFFFFSLHNKQ